MILLPRYPKAHRGQPTDVAVHAWESRPWMREEVADHGARLAMLERIRSGAPLLLHRRAPKRAQGGFILNPYAFGSGAATDPFFANVSLLMHGGGPLGVNGATATIDSSSYAHTVTRVNSPTLSNTQTKFGATSMKFPGGANDRWTIVPTSEMFFGTGEFTIEYWIYATSWAAAPYVLSFYGGSGTGWYCNHTVNGSLTFGWTGVANGGFTAAGATSLNTGQWYFIVLQRRNIAGTMTMEHYKDGTQVGTPATNTVNITDTGAHGYIGDDPNNWHAGYMEDVRVTKGVARYSANFTPPTAAFPDS